MGATFRSFLERVNSVDVYHELHRQFARRVPINNAEIASIRHFENYLSRQIRKLEGSKPSSTLLKKRNTNPFHVFW